MCRVPTIRNMGWRKAEETLEKLEIVSKALHSSFSVFALARFDCGSTSSRAKCLNLTLHGLDGVLQFFHHVALGVSADGRMGYSVFKRVIIKQRPAYPYEIRLVTRMVVKRQNHVLLKLEVGTCCNVDHIEERIDTIGRNQYQGLFQ